MFDAKTYHQIKYYNNREKYLYKSKLYNFLHHAELEVRQTLYRDYGKEYKPYFKEWKEAVKSGALIIE